MEISILQVVLWFVFIRFVTNEFVYPILIGYFIKPKNRVVEYTKAKEFNNKVNSLYKWKSSKSILKRLLFPFLLYHSYAEARKLLFIISVDQTKSAMFEFTYPKENTEDKSTNE
jgi:hypothetical protein